MRIYDNFCSPCSTRHHTACASSFATMIIIVLSGRRRAFRPAYNGLFVRSFERAAVPVASYCNARAPACAHDHDSDTLANEFMIPSHCTHTYRQRRQHRRATNCNMLVVALRSTTHTRPDRSIQCSSTTLTRRAGGERVSL